MNGQNLRQRHLYLVAKLYELAAEFTDEELQRILDERFKPSDETGLRNAIHALIELHAVPLQERLNAVTDTSIEKNKGQRTVGVSTFSSLQQIFGDRAAFPSLEDIAKVLPLVIEPRPKEARERYISRIIRKIESLPEGDQKFFQAMLSQQLNKKSPTTFISKWTKLIKEL